MSKLRNDLYDNEMNCVKVNLIAKAASVDMEGKK